MRKSIIRVALLAILSLGFAIPAVALADDEGKGCSNLGTWFGVMGLGDTRLAGFSGTVTGKSSNMGTNHFSFPTFDPSFGLDVPPFNLAVSITDMRGDWVRTGGNTFDYTFMGFAMDAENVPVYIAKVSGDVALIQDCQYQYITAVMEVFLPSMSPFHMEPIAVISLGEFYGYRAAVDLPY